MRTAERVPAPTQRKSRWVIVLDIEMIIDDAEFAGLLVEDVAYSLRAVADVFVEGQIRDDCTKVLAMFAFRDISASSATRHATVFLIKAFEAAGLPPPTVTSSHARSESDPVDLRDQETTTSGSRLHDLSAPPASPVWAE